jgi:hypothetical protein
VVGFGGVKTNEPNVGVLVVNLDRVPINNPDIGGSIGAALADVARNSAAMPVRSNFFIAALIPHNLRSLGQQLLAERCIPSRNLGGSDGR